MVETNRPGDVEDGRATKCVYSTYRSDNDYRTPPNMCPHVWWGGVPRETNRL
jgi:hypothetical protein